MFPVSKHGVTRIEPGTNIKVLDCPNVNDEDSCFAWCSGNITPTRLQTVIDQFKDYGEPPHVATLCMCSFEEHEETVFRSCVDRVLQNTVPRVQLHNTRVFLDKHKFDVITVWFLNVEHV